MSAPYLDPNPQPSADAVNIDTPASEPAQQAVPRFSGRIVDDYEVERALSWLRDSAREIGSARERLIKAEHMLSHTEALLIRLSTATSAEARKAEARTDQRWVDAALEEAVAAGEFEKMKALREAAALKIEAWRSEQATYRSMKL
jgi:rhamnose utilization protein RhaD (predicted bifunctional aldolase and dehydrogenase)